MNERQRSRLLVLGFVLVVVTTWALLTPYATARRERPQAPARGQVLNAVVLGQIVQQRDETWYWQELMGRPKTPHAATAAKSRSLDYRLWVMDLWRRRAVRARKQAQQPPHRAEWLCIHRFEGRWDDPNPPYFGGLQMDLRFQGTYGLELLRRKGTADKWTPLEQMWVAERAHRFRGFHPWPNTARYCGLL